MSMARTVVSAKWNWRATWLAAALLASLSHDLSEPLAEQRLGVQLLNLFHSHPAFRAAQARRRADASTGANRFPLDTIARSRSILTIRLEFCKQPYEKVPGAAMDRILWHATSRLRRYPPNDKNSWPSLSMPSIRRCITVYTGLKMPELFSPPKTAWEICRFHNLIEYHWFGN
jgi:hypothetical protein